MAFLIQSIFSITEIVTGRVIRGYMREARNMNYAVIGVCFALLLVTMVQALGWLAPLNQYINTHIQHTRSIIANAYTFTADIAFSLLVLALLFAYEVSKYRGLTRNYVLLVTSMIVSMIIVFVLKIVIREPRPGEEYVSYTVYQAIMHADYFGFPSGHTARATVFAYFLGKRWRKAMPLLWLWAGGIALSRLVLGAHWFSDVIGAVLVGLFASLLAEALSDRLITIYNKVIGFIPILRVVD